MADVCPQLVRLPPDRSSAPRWSEESQRPQFNRPPTRPGDSVRTHSGQKKIKSQSVCVCVHARLPRAHCRVYKGELFVCSVSLCHGDFTTVIWFLSPSAALHSVSSLVPSMLFHGRVFFVVVFFFFFSTSNKCSIYFSLSSTQSNFARNVVSSILTKFSQSEAIAF